MGTSLESNRNLRPSFLLHTYFPLLKGPLSVIKNLSCGLAHNIQLGAHVKWDSKFQLISKQKEKKELSHSFQKFILNHKLSNNGPKQLPLLWMIIKSVALNILFPMYFCIDRFIIVSFYHLIILKIFFLYLFLLFPSIYGTSFWISIYGNGILYNMLL